MSPKNSLLKAGLTALGFLGIAAPSLADPGVPAPPGQSTPRAPSAPYTVLLLTDGRVLEGKLSENESGYVVRIQGNAIPVKKHAVEGAFRSLREAYQFQAARLPDRDPDEQMKLARWCLTNHFDAEAKTHLEAVLALSPKHGPALAMLTSLEKAEARAALRDPAVGRTNAEVADDPPRELNPNDLRRRGKLPGLAKPGLTQIFDLPPPLAVKRANEFARFVQPVLQTCCAKCHNEQYAGEFQLIEIKTRHDRTPDVFRANLDSTLRLVNAENPARSELLACTLRPHGTGKVKRPIFHGPNDRGYQLLSTWVNSLRTPRADDPVARAGFDGAGSDEEGFAVDRGGRAGATTGDDPSPSVPNRLTARPGLPDPSPTTRYVPGRGMVVEKSAPSDDEFPVPFMLGGPKPKLKTLPAATPAPETIPLPATLNAPRAPDSDLPVLPEMPRNPAQSAASTAKPKATTKPVQIDPALLERALMNRNTPR